MGVAYLSAGYLREAGPDGLGRAVERALVALQFAEVSNIDGPGDRGADIVADRGAERWVVQCKWKKAGPVPGSAVAEALNARRSYGGSTAVVVTNTSFARTALEAAEAARSDGVDVRLWDAQYLKRLRDDEKFPTRPPAIELRPYQRQALRNITSDIKQSGQALLVLATGLGKTVVAGEAIGSHLDGGAPSARVLVIGHTVALVQQLERALWRHLPESVSTHLLTAGHRPDDLSGVACATVPAAHSLVMNGYRPDFILVDEAHHVGETGQLADLLDACPEAVRLGVTATPWRGDRFDIRERFGDPSYELGIADGMRLGYLTDVDYQLFVDTIDWGAVEAASRHGYTMRDLNARLFLPQRDERIRDELIGVWEDVRSPRGIVFCRTIAHAMRMAEMLDRVPQFAKAAAVHSDMKMRERQRLLFDFRRGLVPVITAVDVLNEGVDVPDVNIICFARVTHSRRIFVQQLGRGLRLRPGKDRVVVLDFVSDLRRIAAVMDIEQGLGEDAEDVMLPGRNNIEFSDVAVENLMRAWIEDAANLETTADEVRLNFPDVGS